MNDRLNCRPSLVSCEPRRVVSLSKWSGATRTSASSAGGNDRHQILRCKLFRHLSASGRGTPARTSHYRFGQHLEDETMKLAIALATAASLALAIPMAQADETHVGVGVGPVGAGVTVGESHERDRTTVIRREDEPRERTTIIRKEREEPDHKVIIKERDRD
jgi:hypothetical protein